jgi:glutathione S-transferase
MLRLYYAPRTRSVRVRWLLEELGLPYELVRSEFKPSAQSYSQGTPLGKYPVLEDGEVVMGESGAIIEYLIERYGKGKLAPAIGDPLRAAYLQWLHYSEGTAYPPMGVIIFHTRYAQDAEARGDLMDVWMDRARTAFQFAEDAIAGKQWILGDTFSAADVMLGFTLAAGQSVGVLDESLPDLRAYLARLLARPALQRALAD